LARTDTIASTHFSGACHFLSAHNIQSGDAYDRSSSCGDANLLIRRRNKGQSQTSEVERITGHTGLHPRRIFRLTENADACGKFAQAEKAEQGFVASPQADQACESPREQHFGRAQSDAEPAQSARELLLTLRNWPCEVFSKSIHSVIVSNESH